MREVHTKQLEEMDAAHQRELQVIQEEKSQEREEDINATRIALDSMRKVNAGLEFVFILGSSYTKNLKFHVVSDFVCIKNGSTA